MIFARRTPGQSWNDIFESLETSGVAGRALPDADVWRRVVDRARALLGDVSVFESDVIRHLSHEPTAMELTLFRDHGGMVASYGATGMDAEEKLALMYRLANIVEEETGLECYDPQALMTLREAAAELGLDLGT